MQPVFQCQNCNADAQWVLQSTPPHSIRRNQAFRIVKNTDFLRQISLAYIFFCYPGDPPQQSVLSSNDVLAWPLPHTNRFLWYRVLLFHVPNPLLKRAEPPTCLCSSLKLSTTKPFYSIEEKYSILSSIIFWIPAFKLGHIFCIGLLLNCLPDRLHRKPYTSSLYQPQICRQFTGRKNSSCISITVPLNEFSKLCVTNSSNPGASAAWLALNSSACCKISLNLVVRNRSDWASLYLSHYMQHPLQSEPHLHYIQSVLPQTMINCKTAFFVHPIKICHAWVFQLFLHQLSKGQKAIRPPGQ